jgi:cellulose synthase/poly-beta-1,6-N-acetylglucosamine synthase-like glycosyltransferase
MPEGFEKNLKQNYKNVIFYILDDSKKPEYIEMIDKFVIGKSNVKIIRRKEHNFAKTGNINNFLRTEKTPCEYYVFLDSDTIMRPDFVELNIKLFYSTIPNLALVTSQISAHRTNSVFENIMHYRVGNTTPYFLLQNNTGMASYLG